MSEIKFTDPDFLKSFHEECKDNPIGSTERMLYHLGKAILEQITPEADSMNNILDDFGLPPASTGTPMPTVKPPKEPEPLKPALITDKLVKDK